MTMRTHAAGVTGPRYGEDVREEHAPKVIDYMEASWVNPLLGYNKDVTRGRSTFSLSLSLSVSLSFYLYLSPSHPSNMT